LYSKSPGFPGSLLVNGAGWEGLTANLTAIFVNAGGGLARWRRGISLIAGRFHQRTQREHGGIAGGNVLGSDEFGKQSLNLEV